MLKKVKRLLWVLIGITILCSGCAMPSNKGAFFSGVEREKGLATFYIYRYQNNNGIMATIPFLDNGKVVKPALSYNGYVKYLVEPGTHKFYLDSALADSIREIDAKPNEIYYLRIDAKMYHSFFRVMDEETAIEELKARQLELPLETATK